MIEFYHKHFQHNYTSKIKQLAIDIERLLILENIDILSKRDSVLIEDYRLNLNTDLWSKINILYETLYVNQSLISKTLNKFINKTNTNEFSSFKFIDAFAGCGGLSQGLKESGFHPVLVNEIEAKFLETYYFNHDLHLDCYECCDIKDLVVKKQSLRKKYDNIDLVVGGPPCQGFSMANRQRIIDDPRNRLYKDFLELLNIVKPKFFIMENVKGMINKSQEILEDFQDILGFDYSIDMVLLNAKDFGVPQNRERVFVIGSSEQKVSAISITNNIKDYKSSATLLKDALFGLPELKPKTIKHSKNIENKDIGFKFASCNQKSNNFIQLINNDKSVEYLSNHTNRYNNERDVEIFDRLPQGENSLHSSIAHIMPYGSRNHIFKDKYYKLSEDKISKTITSHMKFDCNMYIHPTQPRGLSPREAARIQTFPDDYVFMGANNGWYAQIGNAVPVKLASIIGQQIIKNLND
jgi:DNA (cytosine-5)-methyltransferase 1